MLGTLNLYEAVRSSTETVALISVTSDKVYFNREEDYFYKENDKLGGHDPYSSSKATVEIMTESYRKSFLGDSKLKIATVRAGNVIGGGDFSENRLFPDIIRAINNNESVTIRNPNSVRPWQHVLDAIYGYLLVGQSLLENKNFDNLTWNFGPIDNSKWTVGDVLEKSKQIWSKINYQYSDETLKSHHEASLLMLNSEKAKNELSWIPKWSTDIAIEKTITWYKEMIEKDEIISIKQIEEYQKI